MYITLIIVDIGNCRQLSVKEVKPIESTPATIAAVNNTSNVDVVPPLQPSPAKKAGIPPRKSASVHAFSTTKPPLVKTVSDAHVINFI